VICCAYAQDYSRNLSLLVSKLLAPVYLGAYRLVYYHRCGGGGLQNRQEEHRMERQEDGVNGVVGAGQERDRLFGRGAGGWQQAAVEQVCRQETVRTFLRPSH
jgi:hypothetical protein